MGFNSGLKELITTQLRHTVGMEDIFDSAWMWVLEHYIRAV
jgi:hypothetical protein